MPGSWNSLWYLAGVVGFWLVIFSLTVWLTRRFVRGDGELSDAELADLHASSADEAASNGAKAANASTAQAAGGH